MAIARLRAFLIVEAVSLLIAASIHFGNFVEGYRHQAAGTAETVIAVVLLAGLALTWSPRPWPVRAGIAAQIFAILGVCVGLFTISIGVGPQTVPDVVYHLTLLVVLIAGITTAWQGATA